MQRYFSNQKKDNFLILNKSDIYHIKTVMRMKQNDLVEVVYQNKLYICRLNQNYVAVIEKIEDQKLDAKCKIVLCLPLLQEQKMSFILQKATELGVNEIIPIYTERSIIKIDGKEDKKIERWNKICKEASEQSKRLDIPLIRQVTKISDLDFEGLKILCSTKEKKNTIKKVLKKSNKYDTIIMVVGPEGGLALNEEKVLTDLGFIPTTLGNNIMRVETVPIYLLSVLNYEFME